MKKLAIVSTHPIQYNAPWFKILTKRNKLTVKVFYTWSQVQKESKYDPDFGKIITWDIPLLEGYDYQFVRNVSKEPGSHNYKGIDNPDLNKAIEDWQADAVLVFGWAYKSHLACLRYFKNKIPVLFRGDSTLLDEKGGIKKLLRRLFLHWVYRHIDIALYAGTNNKAYFKAVGLKERQLIPALHAIDIDRFSKNSDDKANRVSLLRNNLGFAASDFIILFAGKLEAKKNPAFLLELAKEITDPQVKFLIIGNGVLEQQLKVASQNNPRIKFLEFQNQSEMPAIYSLSHIFILPSKGPGETWGLAANEAMACGLPVMLSSKAGGAVDLINGNGIIFNPDDVKKAAGYILYLKASPEKYNLAKAGSLNHIKKFSFTQITEAVEMVSTC